MVGKYFAVLVTFGSQLRAYRMQVLGSVEAVASMDSTGYLKFTDTAFYYYTAQRSALKSYGFPVRQGFSVIHCIKS